MPLVTWTVVFGPIAATAVCAYLTQREENGNETNENMRYEV